MDDEIEEMIVAVRADTQAFGADMRAMRSTFDATLLDGFDRAGTVLERGLLSAIRKGSVGFDDLQRVAARALDQIAAQALRLGLDEVFGGGGFAGLIGTAAGALFGLPGRATGGTVSPQRPYLVGERGPELFVPASAGRVEANAGTDTSRDVKVSIAIAAPRGTTAPVAMQRSARQVASAVRRALGT
tara:strand:+ start:755 stop:1315 length:561 start_codon:yes stop_codon:yes gene_type:complete